MDLGFRVKKFITLIGLLVLVACVPTAKQTKCPGSQAYDSNLRTCVPSLSSSGNSIFVTAKSPTNSYAMSLTGAPISHSVTVTDVYSTGYQVRWFVSFSNPPTTISNQLVASGTTSYSFDPDGGMLFNDGAYTLEAVVYDAAGLSVVDSESWAITVHADDIPTITNINPTSPSITLANDIGAYTFQASVLNVDDQVGTYEWYLNGALQGAAAAIPTGGGTTPQPVTDLIVNPSGLSNGTHSVTLTLYDGGGGVFNSFTWGILVTDPNLPIVLSYAPSAPDIIDAVDGVAQAGGGYMQNGLPVTLTFTVDDFEKLLPDTLEVQIKIDGGSVYSQPFAADTINIATGIPALNLANSQIPETHTLEAIIKTTGSNRVAASYTWTIDLRPANTSPVLSINHATSTLPCNATTPVSPTSSTDTEGKGCAINQDVPTSVSVIIEDEDYLNAATTDYSHFGITFSINGENMDGTATLSDDVCSTTAPSGAPADATKLICNFTLDSFSATGPLAPGTYELTAQAVDDGSPFSVTPANSNEVKWTIEIGEAQTAPDIQPQELALGSLPSITNTHFELATAACTGTGNYLNNTLTVPAASELNYLLIHSVIQDAQRDSFTISVEMENANPLLASGTYTNVQPPTTVTRINDTLNYIYTSCVRIPEWVRWSGTDGPINIRVNITDIPSDGGTTPLSDSEMLSLYVVNNNPAPVFTGTTAETPLVGGSYNIFAGYPFSFEPGSYNDSSSADGDLIQFQWQYFNGASWENIPGENSVTLTWTPSPDIPNGSNVPIRLCLGDNGGNAADCSSPASTKTWPNITAYSNKADATTFNVTSSFSNSYETASWYDETSNFLYRVRMEGSSPTVIYVDRIAVDPTTGEQTHTPGDSISFTNEQPLKAVSPSPATDLSVSGADNDSLYISYRSVEGDSGSPQIRIRRVEIADGSFSFSYVASVNNTIATGSSVTFSDTITNVNFISPPENSETISINGVSFIAGTDFCNPIGSCTQVIAATELASAINGAGIPGVTATYSVGTEFLVNATVIPDAGMTGDVSLTISGPAYNINFSAAPGAGTLTINGVAFTVGTGTFCNPSCVDGDDAASDLLNSINAETDRSISVGITALQTASNTISLSRTVDWCDVSDKTIGAIGDLKLFGNILSIPYTDIANSLRVSYFRLAAFPNNPISCPVPTSGSTTIATDTFIQDLANDMDAAGNHYLAVKDSSNNIDLHRLSSSLALSQTVNNIFSLGADYTTFRNPSVSVGDPGTNNNVFVSVLMEKSNGDKDLAGAVYQADNFGLNDAVASPFGVNDINRDIDNAKIIASPINNNEALVALTNGSTYFTKIRSNGTQLEFVSLPYPPISQASNGGESSLHFSNLMNLSFGDDGANAGENAQDLILFSHQPGGNGESLFINLNDMGTNTDTNTEIEFYPGYIPAD